MFTAKRHKNRSGTYGGVKLFGKTTFRAGVKVVCQMLHIFLKATLNNSFIIFGGFGSDINVLFGTVGV